MKTKIILLSGLFILILLSCKSDYGKILEAKKQIMFAGTKNAPNHIKYSVKFEIYKPVSLDEVTVDTNKHQTVLKHFTVKDLKKGLVHSDLDQIPPGTYLLTAILPAPDLNKKTSDTIIFKIKIPEKHQTYALSTAVTQGKSIFMP